LRVGLLCSDYLGLTGPGVYLENLIEHLIREDEVEVYLIHFRRIDNPIFAKVNEIIIPRASLLAENCLKKYHFDILHFNTMWDALFFPLLKAKKVATVHGDIQWAIPSLDYHVARAPLKRLAEWISRNFLDAYIAVSYDLRDRISHYLHIPRSKIYVTYLAPRDIFRPLQTSGADYLERKYGIEKPFILHVSNFGPKKNPEAIFKTFKILIRDHFDLELVISGREWEKEPKVKKLVAKLKLSSHVKFLNFIPTKDLALLYSSARVFFQPSFHENCPQTLLEAMSCGTPVVTSAVYSIPEVTGNAGILHDPTDCVGFAKSIKEILTNEEYRKNLQERVLENAKRFSWEKTTRETINVYKSLLL